MTVLSTYEYLKKLMAERGTDFIDGIIVGVSARMADVRVKGSDRVLRDLPLAQHIGPDEDILNRECSLGLHASQAYVVAVFRRTADDVDGVYLARTINLFAPNVTVQARQDGYHVSWTYVAGAVSYDLYTNDTDTGENPHLVYSGSVRSTVVPFDGQNHYFAARGKTVLGVEGPLSEWITDTTAPAAPNTFTHRYDTDGHHIGWSHVNPADVASYKIYRNTSASLEGATLVDEITGMSYVVPYNDPLGNFFGIVAVGYDRTGESSPLWSTEKEPTPAVPSITVQVTSDLWTITWTQVPKTRYYILSVSDYAEGTDPTIVDSWIVQSTKTYPATGVKKWFSLKAVGFDGTDAGASAWTTDTTAPDTPTGFTASDGQGMVTVAVNLGTDTSHTAVGFRYWELQQADDGGGTNTVNLPALEVSGGVASRDIILDPGTTKYYRIRAVDWGGNASNWTSWDAATSTDPNVVEHPVEEKFDNYGGSTLSPLDSLYWLQLARYEPDETYTTGPGTQSAETTNFKEGAQGIKVNVDNDIGGGLSANLKRTVSPAWNLSVEGRFTDDDYVVLSVYLSTVTNASLSFFFSSTAYHGCTYTVPSISVGWNNIKIKKSDFVQWSGGGTGPIDWNAVNFYETDYHISSGGSTAEYMIVDDLRIVKADPDDAAAANDTGPTWDNDANGIFHVYSGNRAGEPSKPFSFGQIKTAASPTNWALAWHTLSYVSQGVGIAGVYLKGADGIVAFAFCIQDPAVATRTCYAVELDTTNDKVRLARWVNGSRTLITEAAFTANPNIAYWIGADWRDLDSPGENRIKVYASAIEGNLIQASNLKISTTDSNVARGGPVGVMSKEANARFFYVRAGSPSHAMTAEFAYQAAGANVTTESPGAALAAYLALPGLVGFWPMSSVQRSTGNVYDLSGQGRTLTYAGNPTFNFLNNGIPYADLDGTGDWFTRGDETDLDVLGTEAIYAAVARGLTLGGWFWIDTLVDYMRVMTKWNATGNQKGYQISTDTAANARFYAAISTDGSAVAYCFPTAGTLAAMAWHFVVARFVPSAEIAVFVNGVKYTNTTSIPASIYNNTAAFVIGSDAAGYVPLDGRVSLCFLCANALPNVLIDELYQQTRALFGV